MQPSLLSDVVDRSHTVIVLGAGGVGKTSVSAGLALLAAISGRKVLCLTIDPARRLATSMGLDKLSGEPRRVSEELLASHGIIASGELYAMVLDKKRTFDDLVRSYAKDPERQQRILDNRLYRYIATSLAGTQEYMAMEKLYAVREGNDYDLVVVDTPPSSDVFGFLDAPDVLIDAIDSPATRWMLQALGRTGQFSLNIVTRGAATVLRGLSWLTGTQFMKEVAEFVGEFNALFGGFRRRATHVREALRQQEVSFLAVCSPSPPALSEVFNTMNLLAQRQLRTSAVIFNRVQLDPGACGSVTPNMLNDQFPQHPDLDGLLDRMRLAVQQEQQRAGHDRMAIERFREEAGDACDLYVKVPLMPEDIHDLGGLAVLGRALLKPREKR
ncbi:MAG: ArsA family ATPase [Myxococcales bacterium]|nr:ArsA family ATPase [Myxococcales bacterium]